MADPVDALEAADAACREALDAVEDPGRDRLEALRDHLDRFTGLLDAYEDPASGSGREAFQSYVEFQGEVESFMDDLPADLPRRAAFEAAEDVLDKRRLTPSDFDRARDRLDPAVEAAARLDALEAARERYRAARNDVAARRREVEDRIADREAVLDFADVDLDADVDRLRDPVEAYNRAVTEAFRDYRASVPAREVLALLATVADAYPLVPVDPPPRDLRAYLDAHPAGREPIPRLLEWAGYSRSKLAHYVDDPGAFLAAVGANRTALDRMDAEPFTVAWPPPPAGELRWRARELVRAVDRFAPDRVTAALNALRDLARDPDYARLRHAARAHDELPAADRAALAEGAVAEELADLRGARDRLTAALDQYPSR